MFNKLLVKFNKIQNDKFKHKSLKTDKHQLLKIRLLTDLILSNRDWSGQWD